MSVFYREIWIKDKINSEIIYRLIESFIPAHMQIWKSSQILSPIHNNSNNWFLKLLKYGELVSFTEVGEREDIVVEIRGVTRAQSFTRT